MCERYDGEGSGDDEIVRDGGRSGFVLGDGGLEEGGGSKTENAVE